MLVFHGTTRQQCVEFLKNGIDAHLLTPRNIHGPQDWVPGLFVTPDLEIAKQFGRCVIAIEVELSDLSSPPIMERIGVTLEMALENPTEPQAFLSKRIEPRQVRIVHCDEPNL